MAGSVFLVLFFVCPMNGHHFYKYVYLDIFLVEKGKTAFLLLNICGLTNTILTLWSFIQMNSVLN